MAKNKSLVSKVCSQCGESIMVRKDLETAYCTYCGTEISMKKKKKKDDVEKLYELARKAYKVDKDPYACLNYYLEIGKEYPDDWEVAFYTLLCDCILNLDDREKRRKVPLYAFNIIGELLEKKLSDKEKLNIVVQINEEIEFYQLILLQYGLQMSEESLSTIPYEECNDDFVYISFMSIPILYNLDKKIKINDRSSINTGIVYHCENLLKNWQYGQKYVDFHKIKNKILEIDPDYDFSEIESKITNDSESGCYVATCVYGTYDCPEVWVLRRYRDYKLDKNLFGKLFIKMYYAISPTIVKWFGNTEWFKIIWKNKLDVMVKKLKEKGYKDTPYNDKY